MAKSKASLRSKKVEIPAQAEAESRAQSVYRALRKAIIEQALRPGMKLPEDAIGKQFGVSRTLVRDAIGRLTVEGLIEARHNRGAAVAYPTLEEARSVFQVRCGLERMVVEELAGKLTPVQFSALKAHVKLEEAAVHGEAPESIRLAGEFHIKLAEMTSNALLIRYVKEVSSRCSLILAIYGRPHSSDCAVSEHRQLIEALRSGNAVTAAQLIVRHLQAVATRALLPSAPTDNIRDALAPYARREGLIKA